MSGQRPASAINLATLMAMPGRWVDRIRQRRSLDKLILDLDRSVSETYGRQELLGAELRAKRVSSSGLLGSLLAVLRSQCRFDVLGRSCPELLKLLDVENRS